MDNETILRLPQVKARTGLSKGTIYSYVNEGAFPAPVPITSRTVGWVESEVQAWIRRTIETARSGAK